MKSLAVAWMVALTLVGCVDGRLTAISRTAHITGTITMPDGSRVWMAKVTSLDRVAYTNHLGVFSLDLPLSPDRVKIAARDGFTPGIAYAETHSGSIEIVADQDRVVGIVLKDSSPI